jgi:hypothetical protein
MGLNHSDFHDRGRGHHIHNEAAYAEATAKRIAKNRITGRRNRWINEQPDREQLIIRLRDGSGNNPFLNKMHDLIEDRGSLSPNMEAAVRKTFADADARKAKALAEDAGSQHVGVLKKRMELTLTVKAILTFAVTDEDGDTAYEIYLTITKDEVGNVVILKGQRVRMMINKEKGDWQWVEKGDVLTLKATPVVHGVRDGIKQTVVNRPVISKITKE